MKFDRITVLFGVILFVSLSINLFMAGMVVGGSVSAKAPAASAAEQQDRQLRGSLSDADKLVLKQAMDANRAKITRLHDDIESIKNDIRKLVRLDNMDEKALSDVLDAKKKKELELVQLVHETRKAATDEMSPEGRAILSKVSRLGFDLNTLCH